MANNLGPREAKQTIASDSPGSAESATVRVLRAVARALAVLSSPWITMVLVLAAIGIILVGTLAQVQMDIWEVVHDYFRAWICWVDLKILFPVSFFPWAAHTDWDSLAVRSFPYPGGALIGLGLVINLAASLVVRFPVKARGERLAWGLCVLAAGAATTWLVVESGHSRHGVQGKPLLEWSTLWMLIRIALLVLWHACLFGLIRVLRSGYRKRMVEAGLLGASTLALGALLVCIFIRGDAPVLNEASLRILYQLIQAEVAALLLLGACLLLYRQRAGNVLLHGGVALLMFGEFLVSQFAEEQQMTLVEGQTVNYTLDSRSVDLAITTLGDGQDDVLAFPMERAGKLMQTALGRKVERDDLPFDVEVVKYYKNSVLKAAAPHTSNLATDGVGTSFLAVEAPPKSGVQSRQADLASAYLKLTGKRQGEDLGTYLVSMHFPARQDLPPPQRDWNTVTVQGVKYHLELCPKRFPKAYRVTLLEAQGDTYVGTRMARNYSSRVRVTDPAHNVDFEAKIWMNNPLRYAGETFYQSGYGADRSGKKSSTLQVVKNTGWMIPYVSCMIVATGMLWQFVSVLVRFLRQASSGAESPEAVTRSRPRAASRPSRRIEGLVPAAVVLLAGMWVGWKAMPARPSADEMQLDRFGALPLMYEGRIKPFDTLARTNLRIISDRETLVDEDGRKQPAIRWLLDVIARPEAAEKHRVFHIEGVEVRDTLGLERRKGARYAWEELRTDSTKFQKVVESAERQDPREQSRQQRDLTRTLERLKHYRLLAEAFRPVSLPASLDAAKKSANPREAAEKATAIARLMQEIPMRNRLLESMQPPLAAPAGPTEQPWMAYAAARNDAYAVQWSRRGEPAPATMKLAAIFDAYRQGDARAFNEAVGDYETFLADEPPAGLDLPITRFEAYINHLAPFFHSIFLYGLALVLTLGAWLAAGMSDRWSAVLRRSAFWLIVLTFMVHTFALAARVAISGRPPVTNLYSSAVFMGWGCVAIGLLLEMVYRLGMGNFVSAVAGIGTLIIAHFLAAGGDTIQVLQAVLDTQFWLAVHVLTIMLGYSAMFLAGLLGLASILYMLGNMFSQPSLSSTEKDLGGMIYGSICFAAFFSLTGTVLGGLWADDSWGRFWGWDPKENGALIIVLWTALVLHTRAARMVGPRGMAILAVGGSIVTAWSWFGVNELGVGLHSYGFTEGVAGWLWVFWMSQLAVIGLALLPMLHHWWSAGRLARE